MIGGRFRGETDPSESSTTIERLRYDTSPQISRTQRLGTDTGLSGHAVGVEDDPMHIELATLRELEQTVRDGLYCIDSAGVRALAVSTLAAASAERAHARSEETPQWSNKTSDTWRAHLEMVWQYLEGDATRHRALSGVLADFLLGPLNHNDGQDGPNDFDRPQTVASYSAVASVVFWGVDFATTATSQVFELIDLKYDVTYPPERAIEVESERRWALDALASVLATAATGTRGFTSDLFADFRG